MSEIECELTAYINDRVKYETVKRMFENIRSGENTSAENGLKKLSIKKSFNTSDIYIQDANYNESRLRLLFSTSSKTETGRLLAQYLSNICDALLFNCFDNSIMVHEFYGYIEGRKRKLTSMIKALKAYDPDVALYEAARRGRTKDVLELLSKGADPEACYGMPLTLLCVHKKRLKMLEAILEAGANPDQVAKENGATMLMVASETGSPAYIELAIKYHADLNKPDYKGTTPLMRACAYGRLKIIRCLIKAGVHLDAHDNKGKTALMVACEAEWVRNEVMLKIIQKLIDAGTDIHAEDSAGRPVFAYAFNSERRELLLTAGCSTYIPDGEYTGSLEDDLYIAIKFNHIEKVKSIISNPLDFNGIKSKKNGRTLLEAAIDRPEILGLLIDRGVCMQTPDNRGDTLLHDASSGGHIEAVRVLLDKRQNPDKKGSKGQTPLHRAASRGNNDILRLLLSNEADATIEDVNGSTPIDTALINLAEKAQETVDIFIEHDALQKIAPERKNNILVAAIKFKLYSLFDYLVNEISGIYFPKYMSSAVQSWNLYAFERLLSMGGDKHLTIEDDPNMPILNLVCKRLDNGNKGERKIAAGMFSILIDHDINVNLPDHVGITPIFYLQTHKGYADHTKKLIALNADINARTDGIDGYMDSKYQCGANATPLMVAATMGLIENVKILIAAGADPNKKNIEGLTAKGLAERYARKDVADHLKQLS